MTWEWLGWCKPLPVVEELEQFIFKNGTTVWASGWDGAIEKLTNINTRDFWATETEPGIWEVQFEPSDDPHVIVTVRGVESGSGAARHARWFLERDAHEQELIGF